MTDLDALHSYRYAVSELRAVGEQLEELSELPAEARKYRVDDLRKQLAARQAELQAVLDQFERVISQIRDPRTRTVIRHYYGLGMSDERIGLVTGISARTVNKVRNRFQHDWAIVQQARGQK